MRTLPLVFVVVIVVVGLGFAQNLASEKKVAQRFNERGRENE